MANFDSTKWYHIYTKGDNGTALMGSSLYQNSSYGTTFFQSANITQPWQQWQIYGIPNSDDYVLRTRDSGPDGFLCAKIGNARIPSGILAQMARGNLTDDSVYWQIKPWNDGFYYLTNKANKTGLHLVDVNTQAAMEANLTKPDPPSGQSFYFETISKINDEQYSTADLPTATNTSPSNASPTSSPSGETSSNSSSSGLSTGAKAGIGAGVGIAALIALVVLGLFLFRRRKRQQAPAYQAANADEQTYAERYAYKQDPDAYIGGSSELPAGGDATAAKHEMPAAVEAPAELPATEAPVEAAATPARTHER